MVFKPYQEIALSMFRVGIFGYGGGPSVIPLMQYEAVTKYKWMEDEEFAEVLAFANALPGPIATKMAAQIGYQRKGALGALVAILAHIIPTSIGIIALLGVMSAMKDSAIIAGMIAAVRPVIAVMFGLIAYDFSERAWKGLGSSFSLVFGVIVFLLLIVADLHPAIVIMTFLAYGTIHFRFSNWIRKQRQKSKQERSDSR